MNAGKAILLISLVIPGLLIAASSIYSFNNDYEEIRRSERYVERLIREGRNNNDRQLNLAYHRNLVHRMNTLTNGTWGCVGGIIAAIGVHGMTRSREENIQDQKKK
ncbi:MAG: hypothetical protein PUP93_02550 [Rhizonema sp. NSF051]|nr:hypothetical protein [Rhizonema sp. NSF051]